MNLCGQLYKSKEVTLIDLTYLISNLSNFSFSLFEIIFSNVGLNPFNHEVDPPPPVYLYGDETIHSK